MACSITDEAAGLERLRLAAASKERREREAKDLKIKNAKARKRIQKLKPQVEITSGLGKERYDGEDWLTPMTFEQQSAAAVRNPYEDPPQPSWLPKTEKYAWSGGCTPPRG